ncbi:MAG: O-antigen ligase family protein [Armatimonadota bacterium]
MLRLIKNTHRLITAFCNSVIKRRILTDPTKSANMKHNVRRTLARILPTLAVMVISLIIAHFYYQPFFVPQKVLAVIYGGAAIIVLMLLWPRLIPAFFATGASVILALAVIHSTPGKIITGFCALFAFALIARRLEIGIIAILILNASIISSSVIPKPITFGGMGFSITELLLLFMLVLVLFRTGADRKLNLFLNPMAGMLFLFYIMILGSVCLTLIKNSINHFSAVDFRTIYNAARPLFQYSFFFVLLLGIQSKEQLTRVIRSAIWIAAIVSVLMIIQYFIAPSGKSVFLGRPDYIITISDSKEDANVARSVPPGLALIVPLFIVTILDVANKKIRNASLSTITTAILGLGILFSFYRSFWLSTIIGLFIAWLFSKRLIKARLTLFIISSIVLMFVGSVVITNVASPMAGRFDQAIIHRFASVFNLSAFNSTSLKTRFNENHKAISNIKKNPVFGIGVGNPIRYVRAVNPITRGQVLVPVNMMHNSFLELWLVYGIFGVFCFGGLSTIFLLRCYQLFKKVNDPIYKSFTLAFFVAYIGYLLRCQTQMHILHDISQISTVAFLWGFIEVVLRFYREGKLHENPPNSTKCKNSLVQR